MIYEVRDIYGRTIVLLEARTLNAAIEMAWANHGLSGADLAGQDLSGLRVPGAGLYGADLRGANLRDANLCSADLRGSDLRGAILSRADLSDCRLAGANLCGAIVDGAGFLDADLCRADLRDIDFSMSTFDGADFLGADMRGAKGADGAQDKYRDGLWAVLDGETDNTVGVLSDIMSIGEIRGRREPGVRFVLAETLTAIRGANDAYMAGRESDDDAAEQWFTCINKGDTRENSHAVAAAMEWIEEWHFNRYVAAKAGSR